MNGRWRILPLLALAPLAAAFSEEDARWPNGEATFHVDVPGTAPSGTTWNAAFEDAMAEWNEKSVFRFNIVPSYKDPCEGYRRSRNPDRGFPDGEGDGFNGVDFADSMCGNELGESVAAVTLIMSTGGPLGFPYISQTDIIFNSRFSWDVYSGRGAGVDFRRTALHELGHALGLGHENELPAIMNARITAIDELQADDIAGAQSLYGGPADCEISGIALNSVVNASLDAGDCAVFQLYGRGDDTSYVDAYRLVLSRETHLSILMESVSLDSVLILTDARLNMLAIGGADAIYDDPGSCSARFSGTLPAGEYHLLANTYVQPADCGTSGPYRLTLSENLKPPLARAVSLSGEPSAAIFSGGATADGGTTYRQSFAASEALDVTADIQVPVEHQGRAARLYVMAVLDDGRRWVKNAEGKFVQVRGGVADLPAYRSGVKLAAQEAVDVVRGFRGGEAFSGRQFSVFIGYALDSAPLDIHHNGEPIRFSID